MGSYPARNYCWETAINEGYDYHFIFDDNIYNFCRLNNGIRKRCSALLALQTMEDFVSRYENIGICGYNYQYFVTSQTKKAFTINTHVYSGMLIRNNLKYRWRLKYNEDVDLCLQILNSGKLCTVLFNAFLINKISTVTKMKGGNQTDLYKNNNDKKKILKARSLQEIWPQYVKVCMRFNRPHHSVVWKKYFHQPLIKKC